MKLFLVNDFSDFNRVLLHGVNDEIMMKFIPRNKKSN